MIKEKGNKRQTGFGGIINSSQRVSVREMKQHKTKQASGTGQKREAEEPLALPTLGQVAEEERFVSLRGLLQPVALTPVNELGEHTKTALRKTSPAETALVLESFFDACDARAREIERKRAHVASGEKSPGKQRRERLVFFLSALVVCVSSFFARELVVSVQGGARAA